MRQNSGRLLLTSLLKNYFINSIHDQRKFTLFSLLSEGFKDYHIQTLNNNLESIGFRPINEETQFQASTSSKNCHKNVRNINSYKWWEKTNEFEDIPHEKPRNFFDYIKFFISNLKSTETCPTCKSELYLLGCKNCNVLPSPQRGFKLDEFEIKRPGNLLIEKEQKIINLDEEKTNEFSFEPFGLKAFKNLTETNQNLVIGSENENTTMKLRLTVKKVIDEGSDKNKYDINSIFGKVKDKRSAVSKLMESIKESEEVNSSFMDKSDEKPKSVIDNEESKQVKFNAPSKQHNKIFAALRSIGGTAQKAEKISLRDDFQAENIDKF